MKRSELRAWLLALVCVAGLSACRDNGLPDRNLPLEEAQTREFRYSVYEAAPDNTPVAVAGRHWMRGHGSETIPGRLLVPVGDANGTALYAVRGERAPYSVLYSRVSADQWTPYLRTN